MSRIGNNPIAIPAGVEVNISEGEITVKGPKGELSQAFDYVEVSAENNQLIVSRKGESKIEKSKHGLYRSLI